MKLCANEIVFGPQVPKIIITTAFIECLIWAKHNNKGFSCIKNIFPTALFGRYYYFPYFTIEKTETQEG